MLSEKSGFAILFSLAAVFPSLAGSSGLQAIPEKIDLGQMDQGVEVKWSFEIANRGEHETRIDDVLPSCGCTAVQPFDRVVHPGQRIKILGTFIPLNMAAGDFQKGIRVWEANGKESRELPPVLLTGRVRSIAVLDPPVVDLGEIQSGSAGGFVINARRGDSPRKWDEIRGDANLFKVDVESKDRDHFIVKGTWRGSEIPIGSLKDRIAIHICDAGRPFLKYEIPVVGKIVGEVEAQPGSVFFGSVAPGAVEKRTCVIRARLGERLKLEGATCMSGTDRIKVRELSNSDTNISVEVTADASQLKGNFSEVITLHLIGRQKYALNLPCIGYLRE